MFKPSRYCLDLMNRLQARRELRRFKHLLNSSATSRAVALALSSSMQPPRFTSRWLV